MMSNFQSSAMTQAPSISVSSQEQTVLTEMFLEARVCFLILHFMRWFSLYIGPVHNTDKLVHVQKQCSLRCFQSVLRCQSDDAFPSLYSVPKLVSSDFLIFQGWSSQRSCILQESPNEQHNKPGIWDSKMKIRATQIEFSVKTHF